METVEEMALRFNLSNSQVGSLCNLVQENPTWGLLLKLADEQLDVYKQKLRVKRDCELYNAQGEVNALERFIGKITLIGGAEYEK